MAALSVLAGYLGSNGQVSSVPLAFIEPTVNAAGVLPSYNLSEPVTVSWTTPWNFTNVLVLQADGSGNYQQDVIAANYSRDVTSLSWDATALNGASLSNAFHFRLENGESTSCATCTTDSTVFSVVNGDSASSSSSSTTGSLTTSTSVSSTAAPSSTASAAPSTTSAATTLSTSTTSSESPSTVSSQSPSSVSAAPSATYSQFIPPPFELSTGAKIGIGLGVAFGILGALIFYALIHLLLERRRKRKSGSTLTAGLSGGAAAVGETKVRPTSGESFASAVSHSRFEFERPDGTPKPDPLYPGGFANRI